MNWGEFRTQIRRSILKEPSPIKWSDAVLQDLCGWALDTFCAHTAAVSAATFEPAETFTLPENVFGDVETSGVLYYRASEDAPLTYFTPMRLEFTDEPTFSVWGNTLTLSQVPTGGLFTLKYYALYPHPTSDSDPITIPAWARNAVAHLIGALAQTPEAIQSAGIDRWKSRDDSGNPEDNALRIQQSHLMKFYENEITRFPRQMRENVYRRV